MPLVKSISIFLSLALALYLGQALKPVKSFSTDKTPELEEVIPKSFGDWVVDDKLPIVLGSPDREALLDLIYSQVLSRTYVNALGQRVMLSIAYGTDQNKELQVHFPEVCYPAQGFELVSQKEMEMTVAGVDIPVKQLETNKGGRKESVTYWVRVGHDIVNNRFQLKLSAIKYGMQGYVADGLLFRVSSVGEKESSTLHTSFVNEMIRVMPQEDVEFVLANSLNIKSVNGI